MLVRAIVSLCLLAFPFAAQAQNWPDRPVRFIVTQAAGGTPDLIARLIAEKLAKGLGQQVVVENRPGAGNVIGAQAAARSAPDGYTFLFATAAALVTNPHTFKSLPYDAQKDFVPVGNIARVPFFIMVHPSVEAKSLKERIALEKAKPMASVTSRVC
jgi:tripartite-type tricarboxylate transporter receptor subunit TctC